MATFGYETKGANITGIPATYAIGSGGTVLWTPASDGTLDSITVYLQQYSGSTPKIKCLAYKHSDSSLVGVTEEWTLTAGWDNWKTFNFASHPAVTAGTQYVLQFWTELAVNWCYDDGDTNEGHYFHATYDTPPDPASFYHAIWRVSIYATYTPAGVAPKGTISIHAKLAGII